MATYLLVNLVFIAAAIVAFRIRLRRPSKVVLLLLGILLVLTAVFDSMIVGFGMVAYDPTKNLGILVGTAPIEDFFYAILATMLVPVVWKMTERKS